MKRLPRKFGLSILILLLSACSATGPKFRMAAPPAKDEALIYLYRPDAPYYGGIQSHFYVDGKKVASLNKEGYSAFYLPSGKHMIKQHWSGMDNSKDTIQFPIELVSGETCYYRLTIGLKSFNIFPISASHEWMIVNVPEAEAVSEIGVTRFQPPFDVKAVSNIGNE